MLRITWSTLTSKQEQERATLPTVAGFLGPTNTTTTRPSTAGGSNRSGAIHWEGWAPPVRPLPAEQEAGRKGQ
jgi:hypothetical protein